LVRLPTTTNNRADFDEVSVSDKMHIFMIKIKERICLKEEVKERERSHVGESALSRSSKAQGGMNSTKTRSTLM
jgi:hypothetical protein